MKKISFSPTYVLVIIVAIFSTWLIHEFSHWITSELLGHPAKMRINSVSPLNGKSISKIDQMIISAAGPIITMLQAILMYFLLIKRWNPIFYAFLFIAFYMRFLASGMNVIQPNDEGRISEYLGLGLYTVPILVSLFLFYLVYKISRKHQISRKSQLIMTLLVLLFSSILIMADQFFRLRII